MRVLNASAQNSIAENTLLRTLRMMVHTLRGGPISRVIAKGAKVMIPTIGVRYTSHRAEEVHNAFFAQGCFGYMLLELP